jgi:predicted alpha/beta-fold hydrolase
MKALAIGALEFLAFLIVTINFRACAKGKIGLTVGTDVLISANGFLLTKMIVQASTPAEMIAYVVGASLGSTLGMLLTKRWDEP